MQQRSGTKVKAAAATTAIVAAGVSPPTLHCTPRLVPPRRLQIHSAPASTQHRTTLLCVYVYYRYFEYLLWIAYPFTFSVNGTPSTYAYAYNQLCWDLRVFYLTFRLFY